MCLFARQTWSSNGFAARRTSLWHNRSFAGMPCGMTHGRLWQVISRIFMEKERNLLLVYTSGMWGQKSATGKRRPIRLHTVIQCWCLHSKSLLKRHTASSHFRAHFLVPFKLFRCVRVQHLIETGPCAKLVANWLASALQTNSSFAH